MVPALRSRSLCTILAVVVIAAAVSVQVLWKGADGEGWRNTIRSDAKGYYSYLVALFIRHDLGQEPPAWEYIHHTPTGTLNKYFSGTAVMMSPWFAAGHALALLDPDAPNDGYSVWYMKAIAVGGWVYLLLGLLALRALLLGMGARDAVVAWTVAMLGLGTTLLQYTAVQPGWSHVYSFCAISTFLLLVHRLHTSGTWWPLVPAAALLGLIVLIRPVNALVVLAIPVVAGDDTLALLRRLVKRPGLLLLAAAAGAAVVSLQPLLWHAQTGNWLEWGYRSEGFHWGRPEVLEVLFGFRRGLFLWSPALLVPALCALWWWRTDRVRSAATLLYWAANTYVIAAWWIWYYGSGFGSRVYLDHLPVLVIPMAMVLSTASAGVWRAVQGYLVLCIVLFQLQYVQYHRGILHHEHMDRAKYMATFLKLGDAHRDRLGGKWEVPPFHPNGMQRVLLAATDLERSDRHWQGGHLVQHPDAFSGTHVCVFDAGHEFGTLFQAAPSELPTGRDLYLEVSLQCREERAGDAFGTLAVVAVQDSTDAFAFYTSFRMDPVPGHEDGAWRLLEYRIPVPALQDGQRLSFYLWNQEGRARFVIDDLIMQVWAVNPY